MPQALEPLVIPAGEDYPNTEIRICFMMSKSRKTFSLLCWLEREGWTKNVLITRLVSNQPDCIAYSVANAVAEAYRNIDKF
jgi:hypothetical protein